MSLELYIKALTELPVMQTPEGTLIGEPVPGGDSSVQDAAPIGTVYIRVDGALEVVSGYIKISTDTNSILDWEESFGGDSGSGGGGTGSSPISTTTTNGVKNPTIVDFSMMSDANSAQWWVNVIDEVDGTNRSSFSVIATHDKSVGDALNVKHSVFQMLHMGSGIPGLTIAVTLNDTGVGQSMRLIISSDDFTTVKTTRLNIK